jgi:outer membrane protein OmpA-like peptidoglycan-associated protein
VRNQELSELRAGAVKNWIINQGVSPTKITRTIGYVSSRPVIPEPKRGTKDQIEAARKQNRRIAVRVVETCK